MLAKKASFWNGTDICMQDGKRETSRIATHMDEIKGTINQDSRFSSYPSCHTLFLFLSTRVDNK